MNFTTSRIAAAATLAVAASSALALPGTATPNRPLANYTAGTTDIYLAGSSAVDLALTKFIANACLPGTLDVYRSDSGIKTNYLWTCEADGTGGTFAMSNSKIAIHKNTNSSGEGLLLLQDTTGATVTYLQVSDLTAASNCPTAAVTVPASGGIPAYLQTTCGTTAGVAGAGTLLAQPTFGFSDAEPKQFGTTTQTAQVTTAYPFGLIFGIPVTKTLRNALQAAQGLTVGSESEANMPNITAAQINAIYTGRYSTWTNALGVTIPGDDNIYKVRRSNGSGSTRVFNATFIWEFCVPGLTGTAAGVALNTPATECVASTTSAQRSKQAQTSDDLAACVSNYDAQSTPLGAIGYLSTDYQPTAADGYRFVKVDGYTPKLLNVVDGKYKMWGEQSMNYNTLRGIPGDFAVFFNRFKSASADGAYLSEVDKALTQTLGGWTGGVVGVVPNSKNQAGWGLPVAAGVGAPRTDASVLAYPSSALTRATGSGYNMCAPLYNAATYQAQ